MTGAERTGRGVEPGLYQHYKGPRYVVLFVGHAHEVHEKHGIWLAVFVGPDGTINVGQESKLVHGHTQLFFARNSSDKPMSGPVVVYVSLDHQSVNLRGADEFNEVVDEASGQRRFTRIA